MTRALREHRPGFVHHVTQRGVEGRPIFLDDRDRRLFHTYLTDLEFQTRTEVVAYCQMTNHFHLALRVLEYHLKDFMQRLQTRYAVAFNRRYDRKGHLFQARYYEKPCLNDRYYVALIRYIHMNPVKAGIVLRPEDWPWSSMGEYRARGLDGMLPEMGDIPEFSDKDFEAPLKKDEFTKARPLSALSFARLPLSDLIARVASDDAVVAELLSHSRRPELVEARRRAIIEAAAAGYKPREIAEFLRMSESSISRALTKCKICKA